MSRRTRTSYTVAVAGLSLLLAACGTETDGEDAAGSPTSTTSPTPTPTSSEEPTVTQDPTHTRIPTPSQGASAEPSGQVDPSVLEREDVQAAVAAEAERRGVAQDEVVVARFASVTWNDGSLGCPQPGMMYTQALVPGYQLILAVDGQEASYHAGRDQPFAYCADPVDPLSPEQGGTTDM